MSEPRAVYDVIEWHNCYADSWNGIIVADAFTHPAKFARGLIRRIYQHMIDRGYIAPGDSVVDPFGGVGLGGMDAMTFGLHYVGCELEPRFVELGNRNIDKWRHDLRMLNGRLGTARLIQGDSRRLVEVVGGGMAAATISSPPYDTDQMGGGGRDMGRGLEAMKDGYGSTPGQLAAMPSGNIDGWVEGAGARHDHKHHNPDTAERLSSDNGYGTTPGNIGHMPGEGFEAAVSSPPYADQPVENGGALTQWPGKRRVGASQNGNDGYGQTAGQLGGQVEETFWSAARQIVEQTYAVLRPGGYAAWVTKDFIRKGQRVPFSDQWEALCAAVGFEPVERIAALLVEDHGDQLDIFGGATTRRTERKSFFRRLAEKKGSPRIDHEDVIIMRRPLAHGKAAQP